VTFVGAVHSIAGARTFNSLRRHRNYRLYFGGQIVSISGTWMQSAAQAWLVLQLTHSPAAVGVLAVCQFAPYALLGLGGGLIADRLDRRRTLMVTQSIPILFSTALAVLAISGHVTVWEVDLLAGLYGCVLVVDTPTRQAFTVEMVGRRELPNAVALNSSLFNASRIIGPGVGGLIIGWLGVGACFAVNAASYVAVLASLVAMDATALHRMPAEQRPTTVFRGIRDGLAYSMHTPKVRLVLLMMLFVGTISINFNVLIPVVAGETLQSGALTLGFLSAGFGFGALVGALVSASLGRASWHWLFAGGFGLGITELLLAPQRTVAATFILLVVCGASFTFYASNSNSTLQLLVPDRLRGRVLALYGWVFFGTAPVGGYLTGWLAQRGGTTLAFAIAGGTAFGAILLGALWHWRDRPPSRRARPLMADPEVLAVR
jgi:MFS family permease